MICSVRQDHSRQFDLGWTLFPEKGVCLLIDLVKCIPHKCAYCAGFGYNSLYDLQ